MRNDSFLEVPAILTLMIATIASCGALTRSEIPVPRERPVVVPASDGSYLLFDASGISLRRGQTVNWIDQGGRRGMPSAAGFDLRGEWACVGYSDELAFMPLGAEEASWVASPNPGLYRSIAVNNEIAAVLAPSGRLYLLDVPFGESIDEFPTAELLRDFDQDRIDYALPLTAEEVVLLSSRDVGPTTDAKVLLTRANKSSGTWRFQPLELPDLDWVHCAASSGASLYVVGLREETQLRAQQRPELRQRLVVEQIDLDRLEATAIVDEDRPIPPPGTVVEGIALGNDAIGLLLESDEVLVYSLDGARIHRERVAGAQSIAWVDSGEFVVLRDGEPYTFDVD